VIDMNISNLAIFEKKGLEHYLSTKLLYGVTSDENGISNNKYEGLKVILDLIEQR
jgi:hypothetical protein